jgi:hypothetical protein
LTQRPSASKELDGVSGVWTGNVAGDGISGQRSEPACSRAGRHSPSETPREPNPVSSERKNPGTVRKRERFLDSFARSKRGLVPEGFRMGNGGQRANKRASFDFERAKESRNRQEEREDTCERTSRKPRVPGRAGWFGWGMAASARTSGPLLTQRPSASKELDGVSGVWTPRFERAKESRNRQEEREDTCERTSRKPRVPGRAGRKDRQ